VPLSSLAVAGAKDKRAVTVQRVTGRGIDAPKLLRVNDKWTAAGSRVRVGHFAAAERSLGLDQARGNQFVVILRDLEVTSTCHEAHAQAPAGGAAGEAEGDGPASIFGNSEGLGEEAWRRSGRAVAGEGLDEEALRGACTAALTRVAAGGFVNYFGMQRFGETAARNDEVGKHLLLGQYAAAVDALLKPRPDDARTGGAEAEAREAWERSNDVRTVLKLMPRVRSVEREVLSALARTLGETQTLSYEERCRLAVLSLPLNLRRLLAHAYFSRLWNLAASERLRQHGLRRALEGEFVLPRGKRFARLMRRGSGARRDAVHVVTAEEAAAGTYSVRRVVLPLPGRLIEMPRTAVGRFYSQLLDLDGVETPSLERSAKRARCGAEAPADDDHVGARVEAEEEEEEEEEEGPWESDVADHGASNMDADNDDAAAEGKELPDAAWQAMDEVHADSDPSSSSSDSWSWFELNGDYRPLLLRPRRMTWQVKDAVSLNEISEFKNLSLVTAGSALGAHDVFLQFDLPPGAYATIALREVQKENPAPTRKTHIRF
jgi:tRNA pseudouridine13 synthase